MARVLAGDDRGGIADLTQAIADADKPTWRMVRGAAYKRQGQAAKATADFRRACAQGEQLGCDQAAAR